MTDKRHLSTVPNGWEQIAAERERQEAREGWTPEHDDQHTNGQLLKAALCYAEQGLVQYHYGPGDQPPGWPWSFHWWKPTGDRVRDLVKAGALIAAEIDRLERAKRSDR